MVVKYDRREKVYVSDAGPGSWPTRLDAEASELPSDLISKAMEIAGSLKVAVKAVRLVVSSEVRQDGQPDVYTVPSASHPELYHTVDLRDGGCDCEAAMVGICCAHLAAVLLLASNETEPAPRQCIQAIPPKPACKALIDELFGDW